MKTVPLKKSETSVSFGDVRQGEVVEFKDTPGCWFMKTETLTINSVGYSVISMHGTIGYAPPSAKCRVVNCELVEKAP